MTQILWQSSDNLVQAKSIRPQVLIQEFLTSMACYVVAVLSRCVERTRVLDSATHALARHFKSIYYVRSI